MLVVVLDEPAFPVVSVDAAVSVIDTASNTVTATIKVGNNPKWPVVAPDGSAVYVTNEQDKTVSVIRRP